MSDGPYHPYTLDVQPSARQAGYYEWLIRRNGTLIERSGTGKTTEELARKDGEKAVERQFAAAIDRR